MELGLVYLDLPIILSSILDGKEDTELRKKIEKILIIGEEIPDTLIIDAVIAITSRECCQDIGWVIDGFPNTLKNAQESESKGFCPHLIFEMYTNPQTMKERCDLEYEQDLLATRTLIEDIWSAVQLRDQRYLPNLKVMREMFQERRGIWFILDSNKSKWALKEIAVATVLKAIERQQKYLDLKSKGMAAPIHDIGLLISHVQSCIGKFGDYCPVRYIDHEELWKSPTDTRFTAEFEGLFYRMSNEENLQIFLQNPNHFVNGQDMPKKLPCHLVTADLKALFPKQLQLQGYCPVTFCEGPPGFESIIPGKIEFLVEYNDELYIMESNNKLEKFMRTPEKYVNLTLPKKLPPKLCPIPVLSLPLVGFLEQTVSTTIQDALLTLGRYKPKHPYKSLESSACEFLALYLKVKNPKTKEWVRKSYETKLQQFKEKCELIPFITSSILPLTPFNNIKLAPILGPTSEITDKISEVIEQNNSG
ncbi:adenylate kinase, partial [Nowakowskiella sp. JEL0078]